MWLIDVYHFFQDLYHNWIRRYTKMLCSPKETDYEACYLVFNGNNYTIKPLTTHPRGILSMTRNGAASNIEGVLSPRTPRRIEIDRAYCVINRNTLLRYFKNEMPNLTLMRNSMNTFVMSATVNEEDIYDVFKQFAMVGNTIDDTILRRICILKGIHIPAVYTLEIMTEDFKTHYLNHKNTITFLTDKIEID